MALAEKLEGLHSNKKDGNMKQTLLLERINDRLSELEFRKPDTSIQNQHMNEAFWVGQSTWTKIWPSSATEQRESEQFSDYVSTKRDGLL